MTLDEAIEHAKELASTCDDRQRAADHAQLAEWLRQARGADKAARWCTEKIRKLEAENAKLSTQLADVTESMGRVEERCAKLRAERDEWHRVAVSKQDIIDHMRDAKAENDRLRERYYAYEYKMDGLVSRLTGGLLSKSAATPNDVLYSSVVEELTEDQIKENCKLDAENAKLRELLLDCWDFSHLMHGAMAARFYELGLIDDGEARELGIVVQK